jgi:hypothetical protein
VVTREWSIRDGQVIDKHLFFFGDHYWESAGWGINNLEKQVTAENQISFHCHPLTKMEVLYLTVWAFLTKMALHS